MKIHSIINCANKIPWGSVLYLIGWNVLCLGLLVLFQAPAPTFPQLFALAPVDSLGLAITIVLTLTSHILFIIAIAQLSILYWQWLAWVLILGYQLFVLINCFFFMKTRTWVSMNILRTGLAWAEHSVTYIRESVSNSELFLFCLMLLITIFITSRTIGNIRRNLGVRSALMSTVLAALLASYSAVYFTLINPTALARRAALESFPSVQLFLSFFQNHSDNSFVWLTPYKPIPQVDSDTTASQLDLNPKADVQHVILIVLDSVRADHTPFYGYSRITLPNLWQTRDEWITFESAYANTPCTESSLSVLISSRYFRSIAADSADPTMIWKHLSASEVSTSFITSSYWERSSIISNISGLFGVEEFVSPATHEAYENKTERSPRENDYFVDDAFVVRQFATRMSSLTGTAKSYSILWMQGTHFPYDSGELEPIFTPGLKERGLSGFFGKPPRNQIVNAYDNSLIYADRNISKVLDILKEHDVLEKSVVIVTADHGDSFGERGSFLHCAHLYNEQVKVPLLIRAGSQVTDIRSNLLKSKQSPVTLVDLSPTVSHLLTGSIPREFEGTSLLISDRKEYDLLIFSGPLVYVGVVSGSRKFIYTLDIREAQEFDLIANKLESQNLWRGEAKSLREFLGQLARSGHIKERSISDY